MVMFGWRWSDGTWHNAPEPRTPPATVQPKTRKPWKPQGFFKHSKPMPRREVTLRACNARSWLETTLQPGPKPVVEILSLAKRDGVNQSSLRRAKRHLGVVSVRTGGLAWRGKWLWQFPTQKPNS